MSSPSDETNPAMVVKCGWAVAGQGDEGDVFAAGAFDVAAADDALAVGEQD